MYDAALKKIFSHRLMIELLIRRHVPEFADRIDFRSLETLNTELIGKGFVKRYADLLLRADLKEVLISEGYSSQQLEEAMTMGTVKTAFQRGLEDIDQQGFRRGRKEGHEKGQARLLRRQVTRRFGPETAGELSRLLARRTDPGLAARAADAILDCDSAEEFLARVRQG